MDDLKWVWLILLLVVIGAAVWLLLRRPGGSEQTSSTDGGTTPTATDPGAPRPEVGAPGAAGGYDQQDAAAPGQQQSFYDQTQDADYTPQGTSYDESQQAGYGQPQDAGYDQSEQAGYGQPQDAGYQAGTEGAPEQAYGQEATYTDTATGEEVYADPAVGDQGVADDSVTDQGTAETGTDEGTYTDAGTTESYAQEATYTDTATGDSAEVDTTYEQTSSAVPDYVEDDTDDEIQPVYEETAPADQAAQLGYQAPAQSSYDEGAEVADTAYVDDSAPVDQTGDTAYVDDSAPVDQTGDTAYVDDSAPVDQTADSTGQAGGDYGYDEAHAGETAGSYQPQADDSLYASGAATDADATGGYGQPAPEDMPRTDGGDYGYDEAQAGAAGAAGATGAAAAAGAAGAYTQEPLYAESDTQAGTDSAVDESTHTFAAGTDSAVDESTHTFTAGTDSAVDESTHTFAAGTDSADQSGDGAGGYAPGPYGEGSAEPAEDGSGPEGFMIKGNAGSMLFHTEESPSYQATRAEVWFDSEESARAAGFAHWDRKRR